MGYRKTLYIYVYTPKNGIHCLRENKILAQELKDIPVKIIISSTLKRAKETANVVEKRIHRALNKICSDMEFCIESINVNQRD